MHVPSAAAGEGGGPTNQTAAHRSDRPALDAQLRTVTSTILFISKLYNKKIVIIGSINRFDRREYLRRPIYHVTIARSSESV